MDHHDADRRGPEVSADAVHHQRIVQKGGRRIEVACDGRRGGSAEAVGEIPMRQSLLILFLAAAAIGAGVVRAQAPATAPTAAQVPGTTAKQAVDAAAAALG